MSHNPYPDGLPGTISVGERNTTPGEPYEIAIVANEMRYCPFVALPCGEGSGEKVDYAPAFTEANARRLVASWNACRHLTTEQLESGKMDHAAEVERLTGERDAAVRDRDAAVEALRAEISVREAQRQRHAGTFHMTTVALIALWDDADSQARAALAKIGGRG